MTGQRERGTNEVLGQLATTAKGHPATGVVQAAVMAEPFMMGLAHWRPWRTDNAVGRRILALVGEYPSDEDVLIGSMETSALANEAAYAHNEILRMQRAE